MNNKKEVWKKECKICNNVFVAKTKHNNICEKCFKVSKQNISKNRNKPNILCICRICKNIFKKENNTDFCCSIKCKEKFKKENEKNIFILKTRFEIFKRDNFTCQYCKRNIIEDDIKLQIDHIIPKAKRGLDRIENYRTSCVDCNLGKGDDLLLLKEEIKNG